MPEACGKPSLVTFLYSPTVFTDMAFGPAAVLF
jgi:hypothetical protein